MNTKNQKLKTIFYQYFAILIVIPLLLVAFIAFLTVKQLMVTAALKNIEKTQEAIVGVLESEIKNASLRLSHLLYVNDQKITDIAAGTDTLDIASRNLHMQELSNLFNFAMCPVEDIVSATFFMKSGRYTYVKEDFTVPLSTIRESDWYQEALLTPNQTTVGSFNQRITPSKYGQSPFYIAVGLSPDQKSDRSGKIEEAILILISRTEKLVKSSLKDPAIGPSYLFDEQGRLLYDITGEAPPGAEELIRQMTGRTLPASRTRLQEGQTKIGSYYYVAATVPSTGWTVLNLVPERNVTGIFSNAAAVMFFIISGILLLFYVFMNYFLKNIIHPVHSIQEGFHILETGNLDISLTPGGQAEIKSMIISFNTMTIRLKKLIQENSFREQQKQEAEMKALQSQINPHFLVNSLNSIRFVAQLSRFDSIRKMAEALIKILSCSFRSNIEPYTVREELEVLDSFVFLMGFRYSESFTFEKGVEQHSLDFKIPRLILQPIVENSIVHAFTELEQALGKITLTVTGSEDILTFLIEDNGKGMDPGQISALLTQNEKPGASIGISNVYTRLKLNYGNLCEFQMDSKPGCYTRTVIKIMGKRIAEPQTEDQNETCNDC